MAQQPVRSQMNRPRASDNASHRTPNAPRDRPWADAVAFAELRSPAAGVRLATRCSHPSPARRRIRRRPAPSRTHPTELHMTSGVSSRHIVGWRAACSSSMPTVLPFERAGDGAVDPGPRRPLRRARPPRRPDPSLGRRIAMDGHPLRRAGHPLRRAARRRRHARLHRERGRLLRQRDDRVGSGCTRPSASGDTRQVRERMAKGHDTSAA